MQMLVDSSTILIMDSCESSSSRRVNDGGIKRLIGKWLNAGVVEKGETDTIRAGHTAGWGDLTIAGQYLSSLCVGRMVCKRCPTPNAGSLLSVRYADDFIIGFELRIRCPSVMEVLPKRFDRFGLGIHPEKTKLDPFGRPVGADGPRKDNGTC